MRRCPRPHYIARALPPLAQNTSSNTPVQITPHATRQHLQTSRDLTSHLHLTFVPSPPLTPCDTCLGPSTHGKQLVFPGRPHIHIGCCLPLLPALRSHPRPLASPSDIYPVGNAAAGADALLESPPWPPALFLGVPLPPLVGCRPTACLTIPRGINPEAAAGAGRNSARYGRHAL